MSLSIMLVKRAGALRAGEVLGKSLRAAGRGAKAVAGGVGDVGAGVARGVGVDETLGKGIAYTGLGAGALVGAQKAKRKKDDWMYRHGFMR